MRAVSACENFYRLRDPRSIEYLGRPLENLLPIHVAIDAVSAATTSGQLALLSLSNQLARVGRRISFSLADPTVRVLARTPFQGATLGEVLLTTALAIDPCGEFTLAGRPTGHCVSIGIGAEVDRDCQWYLGADRSIAYLQRSPVTCADTPGTLRGAALAACLGCSAMLREQLELPVVARVLSAWNYAENDGAEYGPVSAPLVNVGRVLMVGAGAVGAALSFWLHAFGVRGDGWAVVDRDVVELHNTNRGLVFTATDAGWPSGTQVNKAARIVSLMPGATPYACWYHECVELVEQKFDTVLALANDYDVRERLTHRNAGLALQATTGENWLSQLHRHILGRDGCIWCRTGDVKHPAYRCSSGTVGVSGGMRTDAALPFLSAASGLMLATALERLSSGGLIEEPFNTWSWDFDSTYRMAMRPEARQCRNGCSLVLPANVRRKINAETRWAGLDL